MKHYVGIENHNKHELKSLIDSAMTLKRRMFSDVLKNKTFISMFFNPSTRTKTSFDLAMNQLGGHCITIEPGKSSWGIEIGEGAVMDGDAEEHLKEAVKVLCRYGDAIGVRCFPQFKDWSIEKEDLILKNMLKWSDVPIINMETITHPCQALAMMLTIYEKLKQPEKKKFVLSWAYHPKPLNTAVANSAGQMAAKFGMDLVIANPPGYDLPDEYLSYMKEDCRKNGSNFVIENDMESAFQGADFVYAKSWGSLAQYGKFDKAEHDKHKHWIVDSKRMALTNNAWFSHCLPVRRNMIVSDAVIDSDRSLVYDEAENRLHVQKAILMELLK